MIWLTCIRKWLHVQIYRTAVWYMLTHNSNKKGRPSMSSFVAILTFLLVKQPVGSLVLSQGNDHTQRDQWATKAPWSFIFALFASSVHTEVLLVLCSSALLLVESSHIVLPVDNLKSTRFSNLWLWWKEAKKTKCANINGFTQHLLCLPRASIPSEGLSDLEWNVQ